MKRSVKNNDRRTFENIEIGSELIPVLDVNHNKEKEKNSKKIPKRKATEDDLDTFYPV
ncbi:hypothetical protein [Tissierella sp.]|uniref:hypothetical protein n=1 Tax=Tissierella sp. TaxID=41274 RepID=UPI00285D4E51|nr:hypothetical protein [Tissierella sp.]MDR7855457.1 hypothetical protein [Tissierella sp.]